MMLYLSHRARTSSFVSRYLCVAGSAGLPAAAVPTVVVAAFGSTSTTDSAPPPRLGRPAVESALGVGSCGAVSTAPPPAGGGSSESRAAAAAARLMLAELRCSIRSVSACSCALSASFSVLRLCRSYRSKSDTFAEPCANVERAAVLSDAIMKKSARQPSRATATILGTCCGAIIAPRLVRNSRTA